MYFPAKYFPLLLLVGNLVLRSVCLLSQDISLDEPFSIYHAQFDVNTIIEQLKHYNNPPLYEIVLHYWIRWFGISPLSARSLPMLFAALGPVMLYFFAKENFSERIAVSGSLLLSFSTLLQFYAHDCRVYTLFLLLSLCSMHCFLLSIKEGKRFLYHVLFVVTTTLLIYAHYFGIYIILFQVIYLICFHRKKLLPFLASLAVTVLFYSPHLFVLCTRMSDSVSHGTWLDRPTGIANLYNMLWSFSNAPVVTVVCIVLILASLTKLLLRKHWTKPSPKLTLILTWFLFAYIGMFVISFKVPMYIDRYLIYALPAYYLLIAFCTQYLFDSQKYKNVATLVLISLFAFSLDFDPPKKQHPREIAHLVKENKTDHTLFITCDADYMTAFAYYYDRNVFAAISDGREYHLTDSLLRARDIFFVRNLKDVANQSAQKNYDKILYLSVKNLCGAQLESVKEIFGEQFEASNCWDLGDDFRVTSMTRK